MATYQISQLAERSGVPATTLRYYEQAGLLTPARSPNGYRRYTDEALDRLALIRAAQHLDLPLTDIRDLLTVREGGPCAEVRARLRPLLSARITEARARATSAADSIARLEQALSATAPGPQPGPCNPDCGCLTTPPPHSPVPQQEHGAIACSLDGDGQLDRRAEWRDLFAGASAREPAPDGVRFTLPA
ncbi:MAG TPA: MerR family transcriptional regulator, partial [Streptosporangiaceae bacterium]|nr:MerR family transcriptional regulator [Streptosporangiaceae bacterium]